VQLLSADPSVWGSTPGGAAISVEGWVKLSKAGYLLSTDHLTSSGSRISTLSVYLNETHVVVGHEREQAATATVEVIHSAFPLPKVPSDTSYPSYCYMSGLTPYDAVCHLLYVWPHLSIDLSIYLYSS